MFRWLIKIYRLYFHLELVSDKLEVSLYKLAESAFTRPREKVIDSSVSFTILVISIEQQAMVPKKAFEKLHFDFLVNKFLRAQCSKTFPRPDFTLTGLFNVFILFQHHFPGSHSPQL